MPISVGFLEPFPSSRATQFHLILDGRWQLADDRSPPISEPWYGLGLRFLRGRKCE
jgi:hypothetical protein